MRLLTYISAVVALGCALGVLVHVEVISSSMKVGWDKADRALSLQLSEVERVSDPELLRLAATTYVHSADRNIKTAARYVVYFYGALTVITTTFGLLAWRAYRISNKTMHAT